MQALLFRDLDGTSVILCTAYCASLQLLLECN